MSENSSAPAVIARMCNYNCRHAVFSRPDRSCPYVPGNIYELLKFFNDRDFTVFKNPTSHPANPTVTRGACCQVRTTQIW